MVRLLPNIYGGLIPPSLNVLIYWSLNVLNAKNLCIWYTLKLTLLLPHHSSSLTDSLPSLNLLCHSKTNAWFMQDAPKAVWSIPYIFVAFFPSLKQNFIAYCSSKVSSHPDSIFEIHQLWQSIFSRMYSSCCCSCSFGPEIIKIGQSSHKMYSNNILNFQESMTILNACTKKSGNLLKAPCIYATFDIYVPVLYTSIDMSNPT